MRLCLKHVWADRLNSDGAVEQYCVNCGKTR